MIEARAIVKESDLTHVPQWIYENYRVSFYTVDNVPGFTHRVVITQMYDADALKIGWLAHGFRPSARTALYFLRKYGLTGEVLE
jgi:alanine dehydrogenase